MSDIFYYFGIIYILSEIISIIKVISPDLEIEELIKTQKEISPEHLSGVNAMEYLHKSTDSIKKYGEKGIVSIIGSLLALIWIIYGILYQEEGKIFLLILLTGIIPVIIMVIGILIQAVTKEGFNMSTAINSASDNMESKAGKIMSCIILLLKIVVVAYILYQHFFSPIYG